MRKCTSFPSLVVLKHIHMSSMFPFLLLPLLPLSLSLFLPSSFAPPPPSIPPYFRSMKNGRDGAQTDEMTRRSGVFLLLSCCWLSRLTVWQIQFWCFGAVPGPELSVELCANRGSRSLSTSHRLEHTQIWGGLLSCVGHFFFFLPFHFCSSPSAASLSFSLGASPCLGKPICFKTRAKYYHIYIFLFQEGSEGGGGCMVLVFLFFFFCQWKGPGPGVRLCLKL